MTRARRGTRAAGLVVALLAVAGGGGGVALRGRLVASLPQTDGERAGAGVSAPVTIARDAHGVPTIRGTSRLDVARGLGFVHAQDRFFQMDLLRRRAAGELAELFGRAAVKADRDIRVHRFRAVAREAVARASAGDREYAEAYAEGVNAGLASLGAKPFEYLALRSDPAPWRVEDSALCILAMYVQLQDPAARRESRLGAMHDLLPAALFDFLAPRGTEWDAPLDGQVLAQAPVPGPEVVDLRRDVPVSGPVALGSAPEPAESLEPAVPGSNNWAIAGSRTADGRAILADDMHLGISVPTVWYRASLVFPADGEERHVTGVTLPGVGSLIAGSNGHVAWGFTNSHGDFSDLVIVEEAGEPGTYRTPDGPRRFETVKETIRVKGAADETLEVARTIWGPVIDTDHRGRKRVLRWVAHDPEGVSVRTTGLETVRTVTEAVAMAAGAGMPAQNLVVADDSGHIAWTIIGRLPKRVGFDGRVPTSWADGTRRWDGWLPPPEYPSVVDPPGGQIWTANARVVGGPMLALLGDGGYDVGARSRQIRDDLAALEKPAERQMLDVQLDDRALFLARWQRLLLEVLTPAAVAPDPRRAEMRRLVEAWGARASVDSPGYRLVRAFRTTLLEQVAAPFAKLGPKGNDDRRFAVGFVGQTEGPLWALVTARPAHLLDPKRKSWDEQLLAAVDGALEAVTKGKDGPLSARTWGERNSPRIQHPLSRAVPVLARWLDMPTLPIPGDSNMPRVQDGEHGASERFAVSPGHEVDGYLSVPCGQSGHPLSPHYGDAHRDWVAGKPGPFLPGPAIQTLTLVPGGTTR